MHLSSQTTWEAEIGRIELLGQLRQKKFAIPNLNGKKKQQLGMMVHVCHPSDSGKHRRIVAQTDLSKKWDHISKIVRTNRQGQRCGSSDKVPA
jgi:hypothetical protein